TCALPIWGAGARGQQGQGQGGNDKNAAHGHSVVGREPGPRERRSCRRVRADAACRKAWCGRDVGQNPRMTRLLESLDLHVVGIAAMVLVLALILPEARVPWLVAMVPLGRVATRAGDLRRSGTSPVPHLLVNGAVVALATALAFLFSPA